MEPNGRRRWLRGRDTREQIERVHGTSVGGSPARAGAGWGVSLCVCVCPWGGGLPPSHQDPPNPGVRRWRPFPLNFFTVNKTVGLVGV